MSIKEWADLASAIQSFAVAIGVIVGGGWALFQFISMNTIAKARAELETAKRALRERGLLSFTIEYQLISFPPGDDKWLLCTISIENIGNGMESIDWESTTLTATPIVHEAKKMETLVSQTITGSSCRPTDAETSIVVPGEKFQTSYLVCLPGSGLYMLTFNAKASPIILKDETLQMFSSGLTLGSGTWDTNKIVFIN